MRFAQATKPTRRRKNELKTTAFLTISAIMLLVTNRIPADSSQMGRKITAFLPVFSQRSQQGNA
jgi:hypothetical protein